MKSALSLALLLTAAALPAADCASYEMLHTFADAPRPADEGNYFTGDMPPIFDAAGNAYFNFEAGGHGGHNGSGSFSSGFGAIMKLTPAGTLTVLRHLTGKGGPTPGEGPRTGLTWGPDGMLYGYARGGSNSLQPNGSYTGIGVVFRCSTDGSTCTALHTRPVTNPETPAGSMLLASDGNFYGLTEDGGTANRGTVYRVTPAGVYTILASFTGVSPTPGPLEGDTPRGALVERSDGGVPHLYGVCFHSLSSGTTGHGKVFKFPLPAAAATSVAPATVVQFGDSVAPVGSRPDSGLVKAADGTLYGTTYGNGSVANNNSVVYKIDTAGNYSVVYNSGTGTGALDVSELWTTPVIGPDGFLYCTTTRDLLRVRPNGTGAQRVFTYTAATPPGAGQWNLFSPGQWAVRPADNLLVGLSDYQGKVSTGPYAGRNTYGSLLTFNTTTQSLNVLKDFHLHTTPDAPSLPNAGLIEEGDYWYGTTYQGGSATGNSEGSGALYRMHKATRVVETLYSFDTSAAVSPGHWPQGTMRADTGPIAGRRYLYGTCESGTLGSTGGCVWRYDLTANTLTDLVQFTYSSSITLGPTVLHGETPVGQLENGGDGYLYGVTASGGLNGAGIARGTIYRINLNDGTGQTIHTFNGNSGTFTSSGASGPTAYGTTPLTGLTAARRYGDPAEPMVLYGVTTSDAKVTASSGTAAAKGTLFYITTGASPVFTHILQFGGVSNTVPGSSPRGKLLAHGTGAAWALYGTTETGGLDGGAGSRQDGTVFRYTHSVSSSSYTMLAAFEYFSPAGAFKGYSPREGVVLGPDGRLYGTARHSSEEENTSFQRHGGIFRIESLTTPAQLPTEIASFTGYSSFGSTPGINSSYLYGGYNIGIPLTVGSDGHLLGATQEGGLGDGVLYRVKIGSDVQTLTAAPVSTTSATLNASVTVNNETPTVRFTWWPTASPGSTSTFTTPAITASGTVSHALSGLLTNSSYSFKAEVISCGGSFTRSGGTQAFITTTIYEQWRQANFGANAGNSTIADDNADPDKDGTGNLLEFMTGTDPNVRSQPAIENVRISLVNSGFPLFTSSRVMLFEFYQRPMDPGFSLTLWTSTDLQNWTEIPAGLPLILAGSISPYNIPDWPNYPANQNPGLCRGDACRRFGRIPATTTHAYVRLKATRP